MASVSKFTLIIYNPYMFKAALILHGRRVRHRPRRLSP
jgi:hypothetical protein